MNWRSVWALSLLIVLSAPGHASETRDPRVAQVFREALTPLLARWDRIDGLELVVAEAPEDRDVGIASRWGHALLRFVETQGDPIDNLVLGFAAGSGDHQISRWKAISGAYPVIPVVQSFGGYWLTYFRGQGRRLDRTIIPVSPQSLTRLRLALERLRDGHEDVGSYAFFTNNCAGALASLLELAGFPADGPKPIRPNAMNQWLGHHLMAPYPTLRDDHIRLTFEKAARLLGLESAQDVQSAADGAPTHWPMDSADRLALGLTVVEQARLLHELPFLSPALRQHLLAIIRQAPTRPTLDHIIGLTPVPSSLYRLAAQPAEALEQLEAEAKLFGSKAQHEAHLKRDFAHWRAHWSHPSDDTLRLRSEYLKAPELVTHYRLLLESIQERSP